MLRITKVDDGKGPISLLLEGGIVGPFAADLERACRAVLARGRTVALDLRAVTALDGAGTRTIRRLSVEGAVLVGGSRIAEELILGDWAGPGSVRVPPSPGDRTRPAHAARARRR